MVWSGRQRCFTLGSEKWSLQSGLVTTLSSLTLKFLVPSLLLLQVHEAPTNSRSCRLHKGRTSLNSAIWFSHLLITEKCSSCHIVSLKSPTIIQGSLLFDLILLSRSHIICLSWTWASPYTKVHLHFIIWLLNYDIDKVVTITKQFYRQYRASQPLCPELNNS